MPYLTIREPNKLPIRKTAGWTLLEALAAITVLGVLLVFLFPLFSKARLGSEQTSCVANLRLINHAVLQHVMERDGRFMEMYYDWYDPASSAVAEDVIGRLMGIPNPRRSPLRGLSGRKYDTFFTCPTVKRLQPAPDTAWNRTYGINYYYVAWADASSDNIPKRMGRVPMPSRMITFSESATISGGGVRTVMAGYILPSTVDVLAYPHQGKQNAAFLDGHIALVDQSVLSNKAIQNEVWGNLGKAK